MNALEDAVHNIGSYRVKTDVIYLNCSDRLLLRVLKAKLNS